MSVAKVITLRLDPRDSEELAIIRAYEATGGYRKQDMLRMLLKTGLRSHGGMVPMQFGTPYIYANAPVVERPATRKPAAAKEEVKATEVAVVNEVAPAMAEVVAVNETGGGNQTKSQATLGGMFGNQEL